MNFYHLTYWSWLRGPWRVLGPYPKNIINVFLWHLLGQQEMKLFFWRKRISHRQVLRGRQNKPFQRVALLLRSSRSLTKNIVDDCFREEKSFLSRTKEMLEIIGKSNSGVIKELWIQMASVLCVLRRQFMTEYFSDFSFPFFSISGFC